MCGDTKLISKGKHCLSDLALRLVPDEAAPGTPVIRTPNSPSGDHGCPCKACLVCDLVFIPSWVVIDSSRHLSWIVRTRLSSLHRSFLIINLTNDYGILAKDYYDNVIYPRT